MSAIVDEGPTPAVGFSAPNNAYPFATHLRGVVARLAFGLAVAAVTEVACEPAQSSTGDPSCLQQVNACCRDQRGGLLRTGASSGSVTPSSGPAR